MKKLGLWGVLAIGLIIVVAAVMAGRMGETSHAFARGRVVLDERLKGSAAGAQTLFIIMSGPDRPMPLGALRKTLSGELQGELYEFALTKDNMQMMMEGAAPPETFKLKARLDRDGVAGPDQPGDLVGEVAVVRRGAEGVEIRIDRVIE